MGESAKGASFFLASFVSKPSEELFLAAAEAAVAEEARETRICGNRSPRQMSSSPGDRQS